MATDIEAAGLCVGFGVGAARISAIDGVSLQVRPGEFVSVVGESGCGKTTLLRAIAGLVTPSAGTVRIGGREVDGPRPEVGFVFQKAVLLDWRRVLENVLLPVEIAGWPIASKREAALDLLRLLRLEGFARRYPRQLSGGMQQRVCIARTLLMRPSVLLMDEPFGALDAITREQLNLELLSVWAQLRPTCVFVTHDIAEAVFLSDRLYLMSRRPGRVQRVFDIPLPRPRTTEMRFGRELTDLAREIRATMQLAEPDAA
jgi:NitT/TauT family transport system ATP-binding protein